MFREEGSWYVILLGVMILLSVLMSLPEAITFVRNVRFSIGVLNWLTTW